MAPTRATLQLLLTALIFNGFSVVRAIRIPLEKHAVPASAGLGSRLRARDGNSSDPLVNTQNFVYSGTVEVGGTSYNLQIDTGSADLWVSGTVPKTSSDTGTGVTIHYGLGQAAGNIHMGAASMDNFNVQSQAFLYVNDASSIPFPPGVVGIAGIGPSQGSQIQAAIGAPQGTAFLDQIFNLDKGSSNYVTFLMSRANDTSSSAIQTSELTIEEILPAYTSISSQPKLPVAIVEHPTLDIQHFSADLQSVIGPDGKKISFDSQAVGAPGGQSIAVLDSGTSLAYVIREVSDAIYGRVQGAQFNTDQEMWMIPCEQELNVTLVFGGVNYAIHPLDTVIQQDGLNFDDGSVACGGAIAPNTSPSSSFDHLMGDTIMRNMYTLMNYGDFVQGSSNKAAPFMQLLSVTDAAQAHQDFVNARLGGVDTTGSSKYSLLSHGQTSASTPAEKTQQTIGFFASHKTLAIIVGIAILCGLFALATCVCCFCCSGRRRSGRRTKGAAQQPNYRDPSAPSFQPSWPGANSAYRGVYDPNSAPAEGGAVPLEDLEHGGPPGGPPGGYQDGTAGSRMSNPFRDSYRPASTASIGGPMYAPPPGPPPNEFGAPQGGPGHVRGPSGASSYTDPFSERPAGAPPGYQ